MDYPRMGSKMGYKYRMSGSFEKMMEDFANVSGYSELKYAPIVPLGHSAMATYPWNFAAWNPDRTLAIISLHGDAPRTNLTDMVVTIWSGGNVRLTASLD